MELSGSSAECKTPGNELGCKVVGRGGQARGERGRVEREVGEERGGLEEVLVVEQ